MRGRVRAEAFLSGARAARDGTAGVGGISFCQSHIGTSTVACSLSALRCRRRSMEDILRNQCSESIYRTICEAQKRSICEARQQLSMQE